MARSPVLSALGRTLLAVGLAALLGCDPVVVAAPDAGTAADSGALPTGATCIDNDGDGVPGSGDCQDQALVDCDDQNPARAPNREEVCDQADNDCDALVDEDLPLLNHFVDEDGDGFGTGAPIASCQPELEGRATRNADCDDQDPAVHPDAAEGCNGRDDDCDGQPDQGLPVRDYYADLDQDGYGAGPPTSSCEPSLPGKVTLAGDCDDGEPAVKPGATEVCNGRDDDCDSQQDETFPSEGTACQTGQPGVCAPGTVQCVGGAEACVQTASATSELCDGLDNDCDGDADETFSNTGQACTAGLGVCQASGSYVCAASQTATTCSATAGSPTAPACDGQDNDCDGTVDEAELVKWWNSAVGTNAVDVDVTPFFYSASGCAGGVSGSGTDSYSAYYAAYVVGDDLWFQKLWADGDRYAAPVQLGPTAFEYSNAAIVQAGAGMAVVMLDRARWIDLQYLGPGSNEPVAWTVDGSSYKTLYAAPSGSTVSNLRAVRGHGGRFLVLWTETPSSGAAKIRMARFHLTGSGSAWTLNTDTAATDLLSVSEQAGAFGVASSIARYGAALTCPAAATLARLALAYTDVSGSSRVVRLQTFNEDGTAFGVITTLYTSTLTTPGEPDVAWASSSGGDLWGVVHTVATSTSERVNFWRSTQTGGSVSFGTSKTGNGTSSVTQPRLASRATEFLISALVYGTSSDLQIWGGKKGHDGTTLQTLTQLTWASGCSLSYCSSGVRRLARPFASDASTYQTQGGILFGTGGDVRAVNLGCN